MVYFSWLDWLDKLMLLHTLVSVYVHVNVHKDVFVYEDANVEVGADVDVDAALRRLTHGSNSCADKVSEPCGCAADACAQKVFKVWRVREFGQPRTCPSLAQLKALWAVQLL